MNISAIFFCALFAALGRYQTIVDRMPFGPPPPNFDPAAMPGQPGAGGGAAGGEDGEMTEEQRTEEEQKLAATIRVSVLNVTPSGAVAVGFTDSSAQPVEHYYMLVGQERKGWKIENADPGERSATISKDGISVTLKLGEGNAGDQGKKGSARGGIRGGAGRIGGPMRMASAGTPAPMGGGAMSLLRARRAQEEERAAAENRRREEAEAAAKRDREERAALEAENAERAKREAEEAAKERAAMQEQLRNISEQLKLKREEDERKKAESGEAEETPE